MSKVYIADGDPTLGAIVKAVAAQVAGGKIVKGKTDSSLKEFGYYRLDFSVSQEKAFWQNIAKYLHPDIRLMVTKEKPVSDSNKSAHSFGP